MQPPPAFGRGGMELPLPGPAQPRVAVAAGEPAQADPRHRLEGATVIAADLPGRWSSPGTQNTGILGRLPVGGPVRLVYKTDQPIATLARVRVIFGEEKGPEVISVVSKAREG